MRDPNCTSPSNDEHHRLSGASDHAVDVESGVDSKSRAPKNNGKVERDCRICHLSLVSGDQGSGIAIELGCSCKDDLGAAHQQCAEAWFKIKGNNTCEICGSNARNVVAVGNLEVSEHRSETSSGTALPTETRSCWQENRKRNFLLACMVFAILISWSLHVSTVRD